MEKTWYEIDNIDMLDTPALTVFPTRIKRNIQTLVGTISNIDQLRPHVKTHKSSEVCAMMLSAGITKFKCATIAEAEMLAGAGAPDVLLAYQPVGPKGVRLLSIVEHFPATRFSCLIDNIETAKELSLLFEQHKLCLSVYIDLNVGMDRTGILPELAMPLYEACQVLQGISIKGLHAYDGHIRDVDFPARKKQCDEAFARVQRLQQDIYSTFNVQLLIVAGGTPTYSIHRKRPDIECSPGTFIYWDYGYQSLLAEQHYLEAAVVVTRVISKPTPDTICVDLGHKAIASENPIDKRIMFLNAADLKPTGHSEEHMTFRVPPGASFEVGDVLYGVPYHICPTVALHDRVAVVEENSLVDYWVTLSRNRMIEF